MPCYSDVVIDARQHRRWLLEARQRSQEQQPADQVAEGAHSVVGSCPWLSVHLIRPSRALAPANARHTRTLISRGSITSPDRGPSGSWFFLTTALFSPAGMLRR